MNSIAVTGIGETEKASGPATVGGDGDVGVAAPVAPSCDDLPHAASKASDITMSKEGPRAMSATLTIVRDHPQDVQDRPVYLWVDGQKWDGILRFGKTFTQTLTPGKHRIKAHNTLFGHTMELDVAAG